MVGYKIFFFFSLFFLHIPSSLDVTCVDASLLIPVSDASALLRRRLCGAGKELARQQGRGSAG